MGYRYQVGEHYRIKHKVKEYPWPCESEPDRTIDLFDDDILTKQDDGRYMKHTGLACCNIVIPDGDVVLHKEGTVLQIV